MAKKGCLVCGSEIVYSEKAEKMSCALCGKEFVSNAACSNGHFICDNCHGGGTASLVKEICLNSESADPRGIAMEIMNKPAVHMHGPEHHMIIGAALAAAYKNVGGNVDLSKALDVIIERGAKVPGGVCGNWGCCGAAIGAGIFMSAVTKTTPLSRENWSLCNMLTSECLNAIAAVGGPRCCKRNVGVAINTAVDFVNKRLGVSMEKNEAACGFKGINKECIEDRCPYFSERRNSVMKRGRGIIC